MRLIGINGFKTSGKDTVYSIIKDIDGSVTRAGFADKLKTLGALALGYEEYDPEMGEPTLIERMDVMKEQGEVHSYLDADAREISGRQYLQFLGANARNVFGDTFWIDQVLPNFPPASSPSASRHLGIKQLEAAYPNTEVLVVTDVRYPNEAQRVRDLKGKIWEVIRPGRESDGHSSEIPLDATLIDYTIHNDGTIEDLAGKVREIYERS